MDALRIHKDALLRKDACSVCHTIPIAGPLTLTTQSFSRCSEGDAPRGRCVACVSSTRQRPVLCRRLPAKRRAELLAHGCRFGAAEEMLESVGYRLCVDGRTRHASAPPTPIHAMRKELVSRPLSLFGPILSITRQVVLLFGRRE